MPMRLPRAFLGRLDLLSLQLFVTVVEARSITRAAEADGIAASAVSKRIAELEHAVGVPLLHRSRLGVEPTDAGILVLERARSILRQIEQFAAELDGHARGLRGQVRLFATETATLCLLPGRLAAFLRAHPEVRIECREALTPRIMQAVAENLADIGVVTGEVARDDLTLLPFATDRLVAAVAADHPLAAQPRAGLADLAEFELVSQTRQSTVEALVRIEATRRGLPVRSRLWLDDFGAILRVVAAGHGVGVVPDALPGLIGQAEGLRFLPIEEPWATRLHRLCVRRVEDLAPPARRLLEHLLAQDPMAPPAGPAAAR